MDIYDLGKKSAASSTSSYLRWTDCPVELKLTGDVVRTDKHYIGGSYEDCLGPDCPFCKRGDEVRIGFSLSVFVHGTNKTFSVSKKAFDDWFAAFKDIPTGELPNTWWKVDRTGPQRKPVHHFTVIDGPTETQVDNSDLPF